MAVVGNSISHLQFPANPPTYYAKPGRGYPLPPKQNLQAEENAANESDKDDVETDEFYEWFGRELLLSKPSLASTF